MHSVSFVLPLLLALGCDAGNIFDCEAVCKLKSDDGELYQECDVDYSDNCDDWTYYVVTGEVITPLILAVVMVFMMFCWICMRCCGLLGGCQAHANCCGTSASPEEERRVQQANFKRCIAHPYRPYCAKFVFPLIATILMAISIWQGAEARDLITDTFNKAIDDSRVEVNQYFQPHVDNIPTYLQKNGQYYTTAGRLQTRTIGTAVTDAQVDANSEVNTADSDGDVVTDGDNEIAEIVLICITVPFVLCLWVLALCGCARNYSKIGNCCTYTLIWVTSFFAFFLWLFVGVSEAVVLITDDACYEVDGLLPENDQTKGWLYSASDKMCPHVNSEITLARSSGYLQTRAVCDELLPICSTTTTYSSSGSRASIVYECSTEFITKCGLATQWNWQDTNNATEFLTPSALRSIKMKTGVPSTIYGSCVSSGSSSNCDVETCATTCLGSTKTDSANALEYINEGENVGTYIQDSLIPLTDCDNLRRTLYKAVEPACGTLQDVVEEKRVNLIVSSVVLTIVIIACILGVKRWIPEEDEEPVDKHEPVPDQEEPVKEEMKEVDTMV